MNNNDAASLKKAARQEDRVKRIFAAAVFAMTLATPALAQDYPTKPINLIIPFGAGGGTDVLARLLAEQLSKILGQPIIAHNRPGAGGTLAASQVAQAAPDGYTLLFTSDSVVSSKFLYRGLSYDPETDLTPVAVAASTPQALISSPQFPARTLAEFLTAVRANPGKYSYASSGAGSGNHIAFEMMKSAGNLDIVHAPFKSGADALGAVMRGETHFTMNSVTVATENPGKLIALGVAAETRFRLMPDLPTLKEAGVNASTVTWFGVLAPGKTPQAIVEKLNKAAGEALVVPSVKATYEKLGYEVQAPTLAQFRAQYTADFSKVGDAIKKAGIQPNN